ncbi:MAG: trypsin-like peptidase domain-containing protein [Proteobacteria bacterium]|nr:trypsin-like peptidase domain-containing protein [Pseudomonadota bacterium]
MRKFWLLFAQACTLTVAVLFVVSALRPDLVPRLAGAPASVATLREAAPAPDAPHAVAIASYAEAAKKAMPAVVNVYTSKAVRSRAPLADDELLRRYFPDLARRATPQRARSLGSGVIVAPEGFVLTNFHVVDGADDIVIQLADGREMKAVVRGADPESDLVVLKAEPGASIVLPAITLGDLDSVHVGDVVLAIGNPFGFGNTVTSGIVSALGRNHLGINRFEDFIQTDAPINPGNSGGALVDTAGNLIGINSTIYSQSGGSMGIGFAIPVSLARNVLQQIIEHGEVTRGWLGIEPQDYTEDVARANDSPRVDGVLVRGLQPGGPAARGGVQVRDVVVEIGGHATRDVPTLLARIAELTPGTSTTVKVWRDAQPLDLSVQVGKRPQARS